MGLNFGTVLLTDMNEMPLVVYHEVSIMSVLDLKHPGKHAVSR